MQDQDQPIEGHCSFSSSESTTDSMDELRCEINDIVHIMSCQRLVVKFPFMQPYITGETDAELKERVKKMICNDTKIIGGLTQRQLLDHKTPSTLMRSQQQSRKRLRTQFNNKLFMIRKIKELGSKAAFTQWKSAERKLQRDAKKEKK